MNKDTILKIGQWLIIALLTIACLYSWRLSDNDDTNLIGEQQYDKNERQHVIITDDKTLSELKKINKELYDSISKLSDVKQAIQIKYVTRYKTDTVSFPGTYNPKDSVYQYVKESDTINYDLKIKANEVKWFSLDISIKDSLMIVTRSKNSQNETTISHGENMQEISTTVFTPKKKLSQKVNDNMYFGVGAGAGYGLINKKADIYIGISVGVKF